MLTTVSSAGPRAEVSRAVTMESPTNPTPTLSPDLSASPNLMPIHNPKIVNITGIITAAPRPIMYAKICSKFLELKKVKV